MGLLPHTNIVVDEFDFYKTKKNKSYVYFLTHMHSDHYKGLSNSWGHGPIYCSEMTKAVLLNKWPNLNSRTIGLSQNDKHIVYLNESKTISVEVELFDANHIAGSVMFQFKGYMGTILHTGDARFDNYMLEEYTSLFPIENRNPLKQNCAVNIDELIFDNTYCDKIFRFPKRDVCVKEMISVIDKNKGKNIFVKTYNLGKEEILISLAMYYDTKVVVSKERMEDIISLKMLSKYFTTDVTEGWIYVIQGTNDAEQDQTVDAGNNKIFITLTGWSNIKTFTSFKEGAYTIPYSSHSNWDEIEQFVKAICPAKLTCVVQDSMKKTVAVTNMKDQVSYMTSLKNMKQRGYTHLANHYVDIKKLSSNYKKWAENIQEFDNLKQQLGIKQTVEQEKEVDKNDFEKLHSNIFNTKKLNQYNKGVKIKNPLDNGALQADDLYIIMNKNKEEQIEREKTEEEAEILFAKKKDNEKNSFEENYFGKKNTSLSNRLPESQNTYNSTDIQYEKLKRARPNDYTFDDEYKSMTTEDKLLMIEEENLKETNRKKIMVHDHFDEKEYPTKEQTKKENNKPKKLDQQKMFNKFL